MRSEFKKKQTKTVDYNLIDRREVFSHRKIEKGLTNVVLPVHSPNTVLQVTRKLKKNIKSHYVREIKF